MSILFLILIVIAAVVLGFIILVQNPKGGGLQGNVAGFSNQYMGVKQTTDVLEKGTWIFAAVIAILCLISSLFLKGTNNKGNLDRTFSAPTQQAPKPAPQNPNPAQAPK